MTETVTYAVDGLAIGEEIDCGRYGTVVNGAIINQEHQVFLKATGHALREMGPPVPDHLLSWYSPCFGQSDGYGSAAEHIIRELGRTGYDVRIQPGFGISGKSNIPQDLEAAPYRFRQGSVRIAFTPPHPQQWKRGDPRQAMLGFTMWEDDYLPRAYDVAFREVDALATPTRFCQRLFEDRIAELKLDIKVHLVPLAIDASICPVKRRKFSRGREPFVVIHNSTRATEKRKGADVAIQAFQKAFHGHDDVKLVLRSRVNHFPEEVTADPRIDCRFGSIDDAARARLYHEAHVLLYPSRGEGFGLIPLEALATGLPSLISEGSGMLDYLDLAFRIPTTPALSEISVAWCEASTGNWHEPNIDIAAAKLRRLYDNYQPAAEHALNSAWLIRENWTYQRTAKALAVAIESAREAHYERAPSTKHDRDRSA